MIRLGLGNSSNSDEIKNYDYLSAYPPEIYSTALNRSIAMHTIRIPITIQNGVFSSQKAASFTTPQRKYSLLVDSSHIKDNYLTAEVIHYDANKLLIKLPDETVDGTSHFEIDWGTANEWEKITGVW